MLEEETVASTSEEEVVEETVEETEESTEESTEDLKARLAKAEEIAENQKKRAEKAEKSVKTVEPTENTSLSAKDFLALNGAGVTADDFDEVQEFAAFKKVSIAEALANPTMKTILAEKAEERKTAEATQTKSVRGVKPTTGETLMKKAEESGEVPDDDAGFAKLAEARMARRKAEMSKG